MTHALNCGNEEADPLELPALDLRTPIEPRPQGCAVPLTAVQRRIYKILTGVDPEQRPLNVRICASATRIIGPLRCGLLEGSIAALVRRHESLRTIFKTSNGVTTQHINPPGAYKLTCLDLSALSKSEAEREVQRLTIEFQYQKIDLSIGPVFEARLFTLAAHEHILIVLVDHMISDGTSNALLDREIWQAYDDALGDEPASLPEPPIQFADYAVWQERTRESWRKAHENYWKEHLAGAAPTIIPVSSETNNCPDMETVVHIPFGSALVAELRQFAGQRQVPLSNVMLMIYATAMSLWCEKEDLIIRCPAHGKYKPELESVIGYLCTCLVLRININRRCTLEGLLALVRNELHNALAHRDFDRVPDLMPEAGKTELEFHWRSALWGGRAAQKRPRPNPIIKRQPFLIRSPTWNAKFWCVFNETPSDICVTVRHRAYVLRPDAVEQFGNNMRSIAKALMERPLNPIDSDEIFART